MLKTYVLKNKDRDILTFSVENIKKKIIATDEEIFISKIVDVNIINKFAIPRSIRNLETKSPYSNFEDWIKARKAPSHRRHMANILEDIDDLTNYIDISFALSLNDTFWIVPLEIEYKFTWDDVSLYRNNFDERLALAAFGFTKFKRDKSSDEHSFSPEFTTDGALVKCWNRDKQTGIIELLKGIDENANQGKENYTEFYMSQIAKALGLNAIKYDLKDFNGVIVSSCDLFTSEKEGYITIGRCIELRKQGELLKEYIDKIVPVYGKDALFDLLLFDALIYNNDRHLSNFGMIIDNDTQELLRPAPIFDNGNAIFNILVDKEYNDDIQEILKEEKSWFGYTFDEQLRLFTQPRHAEIYSKLSNFKFKRHKEVNLSEYELTKVENVIQERSKIVVGLALKLQNKLNQSQNFSNAYTPSDDDDYYKPSSGMKM